VAPDSAAAPRRDVLAGEHGRLSCLACARSLFVDGARRNLLGPILGLTPLEGRVLDALVLPGALRALLDSTWRHVRSSSIDFAGTWIVYPRGEARNPARHVSLGRSTGNPPRRTKGEPMYISGGVLALIMVIALLVWLL
jgi:hypothetical protein